MPGTRVQVIAPTRWAADGVAAALQRSEAPGHGPVRAFSATAGDAGNTRADVLVVLASRDQPLQRVLDRLPAGQPLLWLGVSPGMDSVSAAAAAQAMQTRPFGWLSADADETRLRAAVHALAAGLSVGAGGAWAAGLAALGAPSADALQDPLTPRELEVFELMAKGLGNRDIALALGISSHTAKFHVAQILEKTGSATRTEAVRQGLKAGWIGL